MIDALIGGRVYANSSDRTATSVSHYATAKVRVPIRNDDSLFLNVPPISHPLAHQLMRTRSRGF